MGQQTSTKTRPKTTQNNGIIAPTFIKAQISLDEGSVLRPNGFFPPEIIINILKHVDTITCIRSSQSCKLWYESTGQVFKKLYTERYGTIQTSESVDWKANFYRRAIMDLNLTNGIWWAEALSSFHFPLTHAFSYVASFEGNKVIFNNHHILVSSNMIQKFSEAAYLLDLDTMKREPIDYGTIFANGFKIKTLVCNDEDFFDWRKFEVDDGTTKRTITRGYSLTLEPDFDRRNIYCNIYINMDGSPLALTFIDYKTYTLNTVRQIEVVDLTTGDVVAKLEETAIKILGFIGDYVILLADKIWFVNIFTRERKTFIPDYEIPSPSTKVHYCKDSNMIGCCFALAGKIQFYSWPDLELVSLINVKKIIPPPDADLMLFRIRAFSFDKSKVVVALSSQSLFYAVFNMNTGALIQTFYNTCDDRDDGAIHLAPNGKIVSDFHNLTVYDFMSPKIGQSIPVIVAEAKSSKGNLTTNIIKKRIAAPSLTKFIESQIEGTIQHQTFLKRDNEGRQYRITGIASMSNIPFDGKKASDWSQLSSYLAAWESQEDVRNTFQITPSNRTYPNYTLKQAQVPKPVTDLDLKSKTVFLHIIVNHSITWNQIREVVLVYERLNEDTGEWEFAEPIGLESLE